MKFLYLFLAFTALSCSSDEKPPLYIPATPESVTVVNYEISIYEQTGLGTRHHLKATLKNNTQVLKTGKVCFTFLPDPNNPTSKTFDYIQGISLTSEQTLVVEGNANGYRDQNPTISEVKFIAD